MKICPFCKVEYRGNTDCCGKEDCVLKLMDSLKVYNPNLKKAVNMPTYPSERSNKATVGDGMRVGFGIVIVVGIVIVIALVVMFFI